jgi:hypothetical protein
MMPPPLLGINGRLRQHITKVGAAYANQISSPNSRKAVTDDDFVKELLDSGKITVKQLQQAIDSYNYFGSTFAWMQDVKDSILDRADDVFFAKYGRDPKEDSDFAVNSNFYKICKNLEGDWHYYDNDLEKLRWDYKGNVSVVTENSPTLVKEKRDIQPTPPKGSTAEQSVEAIVTQLLEKFLSDVVSPPKEYEKKERGTVRIYPCYKVNFRTFHSDFPDYDSNENRNSRIQGKLSDMARVCECNIKGGYLNPFPKPPTYADIARISIVLVKEVQCCEKPNGAYKTVFRNWV